ncbi:unnamed protein product [Blepharisma stoltei]|uniref:histidine kinase n=1 Tax=Blepharisma stoltei TaxID=1481888 RepID=A0AAU9K099_9CILI|nr:unnamed protein product [Blepharisma stoltei]
MSHDYDKWWEEEVNERYAVFRKYLLGTFWLIGIFWVTFVILSPENFRIFWDMIPHVLVNWGMVWLSRIIGRKGTYEKSAYTVFHTEYSCVILWYLSLTQLKNYLVLCEILSSIYINAFELAFIQRAWLRNLIIAKHMVMWHYIKYLTGELMLDADITPHTIAAICFLLYNFISYYQISISYERYLNRVQKNSAESHLEVIISAFPDGILILSDTFTVEYVNSNLTSLLNCSSEEIKDTLANIKYCEGKKYSNISESSNLFKDIEIMLKQDLREPIMLGVSLCNGNNIEWKGWKIRWGEKNALSLTARNMNHIIQLEQSISDSKLKTVLLRSVSHELRTPLNVISFIAEELSENLYSYPIEMSKEKLRMISISTKLLLTLVNDLLDYSRMLAGVFSVHKSRFLLQDLIKNAMDLISIQANRKNLFLSFQIDPLLPKYIYSDPFRLSQVLLNFLSNALKFTLKGSIQVVCVSTITNKLKVIIKDTGLGIASTKLSTLFEEFNTVSTPNLNPQGCGLGLHISKMILKELGNDIISVESKINVGSTFSFTIDIAENTENSWSDSSNPIMNISEDFENLGKIFSNYDVKKDSSRQVLIVDDNDFNRIVLATVLSKNGITFTEACTGREAIGFIAAQDAKGTPYSLVIMDGDMPEMTGWEATQTIVKMKSDGKLSHVPVVIGYTAYSAEEDLKKCIDSGMVECLTKPCDPELLLSTINKYIS